MMLTAFLFLYGAVHVYWMYAFDAECDGNDSESAQLT